MAAPVVEGISYPEHVHAEYPKVVYEGGDLKGASLTVANEAEEAEAAAEGFAAYVSPEADPGDEVTVPLTEADEAALAEVEAEPPPTPPRTRRK